jgi:hypothetical protein
MHKIAAEPTTTTTVSFIGLARHRSPTLWPELCMGLS